MIEALQTIAALLQKYAPRQARTIEALIASARAGDPNLELDACGDPLWGDDGLWDSGPQVLQRPHHDAAACRRDELAYRRAFLDLADAIEQRQWGTPSQQARVREVAATFRAWERDGL